MKRHLIASLTLIAFAVSSCLAAPVVKHHATRRDTAIRPTDTRLIQAFILKDRRKMRVLLAAGADPNAQIDSLYVQKHPDLDLCEGPLLTNAIRLTQDDIALDLIAAGADVNRPERTGLMPLGLAAFEPSLVLVKALLHHGANLNLPDEAILSDALYDLDETRVAIIKVLLSQGADVNATEAGDPTTPLIRAVADCNRSNAYITVIKLLIAHHADLEMKDNGGATALNYAKASGNARVIQLLKDAGAKDISLIPPIINRDVRYTVTDLGLGQANALNNQGTVVGMVSQGDSSLNGLVLGRAFLWKAGRRVELGSLGGPGSIAWSVNDFDEVVGETNVKYPDAPEEWYVRHGFLWKNGRMQDLHPHRGWAAINPADFTTVTDYTSVAVAINNQHQIALAINSTFVLLQNGNYNQCTSTLNEAHGGVNINGESATPIAMNESGQAALDLHDANGLDMMGIWEQGKVNELIDSHGPMPDGQIHLDLTNVAHGINNAGDIVGDAKDTVGDSTSFAIWWPHGTKEAQVLPLLSDSVNYHCPTSAYGINGKCTIVGSVTDNVRAERHAVIWSAGKAEDLNAFVPTKAGWVLEEARAINDQGQIVGRGTLHGKKHAFLLTPIKGRP